MVAERAATLGADVHGTIQAVAAFSVLPAFPVAEHDERRLLEELALRADHVAADLREAMDVSADEAVTEDIFIQILGGIEKQRWMLLGHLA